MTFSKNPTIPIILVIVGFLFSVVDLLAGKGFCGRWNRPCSPLLAVQRSSGFLAHLFSRNKSIHLVALSPFIHGLFLSEICFHSFRSPGSLPFNAHRIARKNQLVIKPVVELLQRSNFQP
ncbi:MAG: hypothetical protein IJ153_10110, partial [Clostridia bacterium]|nr:hypothetical protein [Clostridia bacterium]